MRRVLLALMALTALTVVSCTKEKSFEEETNNPGGGNTGGTTDGDLLSRIVIQLGPDSATTFFTYDASKRLVSESNKGYLSIVSDDSLQRITRGTDGTIQKVTVYPDAFTGEVYDFTVRYEGTSKRYTSKVTFDGSGNVEDSVGYSYDASGKITKATAFVNFGAGYEPISKDSIIYDASNNIAKVITYDYEDPSWQPQAEMNVTYDTKVNPLKLAQEAIVLERYQYYGNNNATKISFVDFNAPSFNQEITLTYTYNASNKPATAAMGITGAGSMTLPVAFRYQ